MTGTWTDLLHDGTLIGLRFDWDQGRAALIVRTASSPNVKIVASGVRSVTIPRREPWGPSASINEVRRPAAGSGDVPRLEVEMQSGDVIVIEASAFHLE